MIANSAELIRDYLQVAHLAGLAISEADLLYERLAAPHRPPTLPKDKQAVYIFSLAAAPHTVLKVGKAGAKSGARFSSQHYKPGRARSNLARSLTLSPDKWPQLGIASLNKDNVAAWIYANTEREHFFLPAAHGTLALSLLEVFVQCRLNPLFEGG